MECGAGSETSYVTVAFTDPAFLCAAMQTLPTSVCRNFFADIRTVDRTAYPYLHGPPAANRYVGNFTVLAG